MELEGCRSLASKSVPLGPPLGDNVKTSNLDRVLTAQAMRTKRPTTNRNDTVSTLRYDSWPYQTCTSLSANHQVKVVKLQIHRYTCAGLLAVFHGSFD